MKYLYLVLLIFTVPTSAQTGVTLLKWVGPEGSRPETYEEWIAQHPYTDFSYLLDNVTYGDGRAGNVAIITEQSIANSLNNELTQLTTNLQADGHTVYNYQMSGGTPETLRTFLQNLYNTNSIEGALFIGNLPIAWFEIADDFNGNGYVDFPIDLFYMDLDGNWLDTMSTGNNKYDGHTGNVNPDIYVGRLYPSGLGDDTLLLQNYFRKNNSFRHDTLLLTQRALVFVDDDWIPWDSTWASAVALLYADTLNYWDAETTRATVYRTKLDSIMAWVQVCAHSSPSMHQFTYNGGGSVDYYYANEYTTQNPPVNFYNFFACSFSRYTTAGNCGGNRAVFNPTSGIGSIGSTKTGSMLNFDYFYRPLGQGKNLGTAFKYWFDCVYDSIGMGFINLCWFYGMTLSADPYLIPLGHNTGIDEHITSIKSKSAFSVCGNPVKKNVQLAFSLTNPEDIEIKVYDCTGCELNSIRTRLGSGNQSITVHLKDKNGIDFVQGIYIIQVKINDQTFSQKIVKI